MDLLGPNKVKDVFWTHCGTISLAELLFIHQLWTSSMNGVTLSLILARRLLLLVILNRLAQR